MIFKALVDSKNCTDRGRFFSTRIGANGIQKYPIMNKSSSGSSTFTLSRRIFLYVGSVMGLYLIKGKSSRKI